MKNTEKLLFAVDHLRALAQNIDNIALRTMDEPDPELRDNAEQLAGHIFQTQALPLLMGLRETLNWSPADFAEVVEVDEEVNVIDAPIYPTDFADPDRRYKAYKLMCELQEVAHWEAVVPPKLMRPKRGRPSKIK